MTTIQEQLLENRIDHALWKKAADRIDLDTDHIEMLARVVDKALAERDEYRKAADTQAAAHKVEQWKSAAEYWYGEFRHAKSGEAEYPTLGALDAWFKATWPSIVAHGGEK